MKKFLLYGKELDFDAVIGLMFIQFMIGVMGVVFSYNRVKAVICILPFLLASLILYIVFRRKNRGTRHKKEQLKYFNLHIGIIGILTSLTSLCASLVCIELTNVAMMAFIFILLLSNGLVAFGMVLLVRKMVNSKKKILPMTSISIGSVSVFATLGVLLSRQTKQEFKDIAICIVFALLSLIFSVFVVFIQKYYYFNLLEKQEEGEKDF